MSSASSVYSHWSSGTTISAESNIKRDSETEDWAEDYTDIDTLGDDATGTEETGSLEQDTILVAVPVSHSLGRSLLPYVCLNIGFVTFSVALCIAGLTAYGIALWLRTEGNITPMYIEQSFLTGTLRNVGAFVAFVSLIALLGLWKKSTRIITVSIVLQGMFLWGLFICGVLCYDLFYYYIFKIFWEQHDSIYQYKEDEKIKEKWDNTQTRLACCGPLGAQWVQEHLHFIPESCCNKTTGLSCDPVTIESAYTTTCYAEAYFFIKQYMYTFGIIVIFIALIFFLSLLQTTALYVRLKKCQMKMRDRSKIESQRGMQKRRMQKAN